MTLTQESFITTTLRNDIDNTTIPYLISGTISTGFWAVFANNVNNTGYYLDSFVCNTNGSGLGGVNSYTTNNIYNYSGTYGVTGSSLIPTATFTGIGGAQVSWSGNFIVISGGAGGGVTSSDIVYTTGNQIVSGVKQFRDTGVFGDLSNFSVLPYSKLNIFDSGNYYSQVHIMNKGTGDLASADFVVTANNGNDTINYIDLGINNQGYSQTGFSIVGPNDGYLYVNGGDLAIGTQTQNKEIRFHVGGTATGNKIASIDSSGINLVSGDSYRVNNFPITNFSKGGMLYNPDGIPSGFQITPIWYAPYTCQATSVRGLIMSGTSATINAAKNRVLNLLSANSNIPTTGTWYSSGNLQNNVFDVGDSLSLIYAQNVGNPVSISIQVDFIRT
jgi:hypothetical protein